MPKIRRYEDVEDGAWEPCHMRGGRERCCDCLLTHRVNYRIKNGVIEQQAFRDDKSTNAARKRHRVTVIKWA